MWERPFHFVIACVAAAIRALWDAISDHLELAYGAHHRIDGDICDHRDPLYCSHMVASRLVRCLHGWIPLPFRSQHQEAVQDWEALAVLYGPKRSTRRWGPIQGWHFVTGQSSPFRTAGRGGTHCLREMAIGAVIRPDVHHRGALVFLWHWGMGGRKPHGRGWLPVMLDTLAAEGISRCKIYPVLQGRPLGTRSPPLSLCFSQLSVSVSPLLTASFDFRIL